MITWYTRCLNLHLKKADPTSLTYRDCKNFSIDRFKADLENALKSCPNSYDIFEQCFSSKLNEYAPKINNVDERE